MSQVVIKCHKFSRSWFWGRGWAQQLISFQSPAVQWMAWTSSLNCLSCRDPHQTPHSLNASPLFTEKPFFSLRSASSHPLPKIWLLLSWRLSQTVVTFCSRPLPAVPFWFSPIWVHSGPLGCPSFPWFLVFVDENQTKNLSMPLFLMSDRHEWRRLFYKGTKRMF